MEDAVFPPEAIEQITGAIQKARRAMGATEALRWALGAWAITCTVPVGDQFRSLSGGKSVSAEDNFQLRMEFLSFFLVALAQQAYKAVGPGARVALLEAIVPSAINSMVRSSLSPEVDLGTFEKLLGAANNHAYKANQDYSSCKSFMGEAEGGKREGFFPLDESTLVGKLSGRVARVMKREHDPEFRFAVSMIALHPISGVRPCLMDQLTETLVELARQRD